MAVTIKHPPTDLEDLQRGFGDPPNDYVPDDIRDVYPPRNVKELQREIERIRAFEAVHARAEADRQLALAQRQEIELNINVPSVAAQMKAFSEQIMRMQGLPVGFLTPPPTPPAAPIRAAVAAGIDADVDFLREYRRVANKVGYRCQEAETRVLKADLLEFLRAEGLGVYNYDAVSKYMDGIVAVKTHELRAGTQDMRRSLTWYWAPLREADRKATLTLHAPYSKPIPYPVLLTIEKVVDRFGEEVNLFVSDIRELPREDPFLAVAVAGDPEKFVIERWDEPAFRDRQD